MGYAVQQKCYDSSEACYAGNVYLVSWVAVQICIGTKLDTENHKRMAGIFLPHLTNTAFSHFLEIELLFHFLTAYQSA